MDIAPSLSCTSGCALLPPPYSVPLGEVGRRACSCLPVPLCHNQTGAATVKIVLTDVNPQPEHQGSVNSQTHSKCSNKTLPPNLPPLPSHSVTCRSLQEMPLRGRGSQLCSKNLHHLSIKMLLQVQASLARLCLEIQMFKPFPKFVLGRKILLTPEVLVTCSHISHV